MKIQISKERRIKNLPVIWPEEIDGVDMMLEVSHPGKFPFNRDTISRIYDFGALGNCKPEDVVPTIMQWLRALKKGGNILIVEVDFERAVREFVGADISLFEFNDRYNRRTHLVKETLAQLIIDMGVPSDNIKQWNGGHKDFEVYPHEFVIEVIKP